MALPKRQHSKQRTRKRRAHWKVDLPNLSQCSQCGQPVVPHRVCPFCGFYKGQQVVEVEAKDEEKKA